MLLAVFPACQLVSGADLRFGFVGVYPKIGSGIANPLFAYEVNPQPDPCLPCLFIHQQQRFLTLNAP